MNSPAALIGIVGIAAVAVALIFGKPKPQAASAGVFTPTIIQGLPCWGPDAPKAKVKVMLDGTLFLDGQISSLTEIDKRFAKLAAENGIVWYYREEANGATPRMAMQIMELLVKYKRPIRFSTKPDFSDAYVPPNINTGKGETNGRRS